LEIIPKYLELREFAIISYSLSIEIRFGQLREFDFPEQWGWVSSPICCPPGFDGGLSSDISLPTPIDKPFDHKDHRKFPHAENGHDRKSHLELRGVLADVSITTN
jgi:hypothetical protein